MYYILKGEIFLNKLLVIIGKIIIKILHLFKRNAGNLPGIILWHLTGGKCCRMFKIDCPIIAVTGTNGKTSVTNCIAQLFEQNGKKIIINKEGNNLDTGICSLLLRHCSISGKVDADYLILETDESHVPVVYSQQKLETLVVLNFFRDQLDRNGEMETLIQKINHFCKTFEGNLVLNGDDPNTARLGRANPDNKNVRYFHAEPYKFATEKIFEASEGRFCPFCGQPLEYESSFPVAKHKVFHSSVFYGISGNYFIYYISVNIIKFADSCNSSHIIHIIYAVQLRRILIAVSGKYRFFQIYITCCDERYKISETAVSAYKFTYMRILIIIIFQRLSTERTKSTL